MSQMRKPQLVHVAEQYGMADAKLKKVDQLKAFIKGRSKTGTKFDVPWDL
jgi:hypothetical protein